MLSTATTWARRPRNVANQWQISREMQDEFALASQNKAEAAQKAGKFKDEIIAFTVKTRKGDTVVDADEYIRHGATIDAMQKLRPAFVKDGSVTAANASGLNDGAAAVLLMTEEEAPSAGSPRLPALPLTPPRVLTRRSWASGRSTHRARPCKKLAGRLAISISSKRTRLSQPKPVP